MSRKHSCAAISLSLAIALSACASMPENSRVMLGEDMRDSLGTIGVVAIGKDPEPEALGPVASTGDTVIGAGAGVLVGGAIGLGVGAIILGSAACGPFAFGCAAAALGAAAAATAVGAVAGTTAGVVIASDRSLPEGTELVLETALNNALGDYDLRYGLKSGVLTALAARTNVTLIDLGVMDALPHEDMAGFRNIVPPEVDSVLEIGITQIVLTQIEDEGTDFSLLINIHGNLTSATDKNTIWANDQIVYVSAPVALTLWTHPEAGRLESEIDNALLALSEEIGIQLLGGHCHVNRCRSQNSAS